ncbi:hypothetical protein VTN77DRAFT_4459 [Rasamsonia byssochlamydoides]|uniref:uncharacterized protein n=1 Tax=Rasamsonia byssochlamydoides TaxID=89139 RepID=UPI003742A935
MSTITVNEPAPSFPLLDTSLLDTSSTPKATVQLHALSAGHLTLPEKYFVHPASNTARRTVPSLAFLIQHRHPFTGRLTRLVFDLGLRRDIERYSAPIRRHAATRQPLSTEPDVVQSLARGGLRPGDIDYVVYSHVHWDHIGEPRDFPTSTFVIGPGARDLLQGTKSNSLTGSHSFFEANLLPEDRTIELRDPSSSEQVDGLGDKRAGSSGEADFYQSWTMTTTTTTDSFTLPVIDLFRDGTVYIVHAPGHLPGHINLLVRTGSTKWVYLAGDACHDRRIMRRQREIGEWVDDDGHVCCIHADRKTAEETIERIRGLEQRGVEVIFAHDVEWEEDARNKRRFWGESTLLMSSFKEQFIAEHGPHAWNDGWQSVLNLSPALFEASLGLRSIPKKNRHLPPKVQAFIALAVDSAATHLHVPGIQEHVRAALAAGATATELIEVVELTSTLGIHACNIGVPLLVEVLKEEGHPAGQSQPLDERRQQLKADFARNRGYWHAFWEDFLRLDPDFFEAYLNFSSVPWVRRTESGMQGVLEPKTKELIYCAFDAAATHLYQPGLKLHMRNALRYGASPEEIMEVLEIATALSLHTATVAAPIIERELAAAAAASKAD